MENTVHIEVIEEKADYNNVIFFAKINKSDLPVVNDIIDFYPDVEARRVIKRRMMYVEGKLDTVKLYVEEISHIRS